MQARARESINQTRCHPGTQKLNVEGRFIITSTLPTAAIMYNCEEHQQPPSGHGMPLNVTPVVGILLAGEGKRVQKAAAIVIIPRASRGKKRGAFLFARMHQPSRWLGAYSRIAGVTTHHIQKVTRLAPTPAVSDNFQQQKRKT